MATPLDYLNQLINTPEPEDEVNIPMARKEENIEAITRGEVPEGADLESIIFEATQALEDVSVDSQVDTINAVVANTLALRNEADNIRSNIKQSRSEQQLALEEGARIAGEQSLAQLDQMLTGNEEIVQLMEAADEQRDTISAEYRAVLDSLGENYDTWQAGESVTPIDIITNPLQAISAKFKGKAAQDVVASKVTELNTLDSAAKTFTRLTQEEASDINQVINLRRKANEAMYVQGINNKVLQEISAGRTQFYQENFKDIQNVLNIDNIALDAMVSSLNAEVEAGRANAQRLQGMLELARVQTANRQLKRSEELWKRDDTVRSHMNGVILQTSSALGMSDTIYDWDSFIAAREAELLPPQALATFAQAVTTKSAGVNVVLTSNSPMQTFANMMDSDLGEITPAMENILMSVDRLKDPKGEDLTDTDTFANSTEKERMALRDTKLKEFKVGVQNDMRWLTRNNLLSMQSPNNLNYEPTETNPTYIKVPEAARSILEGIRADTRNPEEWAEDMLLRGAEALFENKIDAETLAQAYAAVGESHLSFANNNTGLGLEALRLKTLGTVGGKNGSITSPNDWYEALKIKLARVKAANIARSGGFQYFPETRREQQ